MNENGCCVSLYFSPQNILRRIKDATHAIGKANRVTLGALQQKATRRNTLINWLVLGHSYTGICVNLARKLRWAKNENYESLTEEQDQCYRIDELLTWLQIRRRMSLARTE